MLGVNSAVRCWWYVDVCTSSVQVCKCEVQVCEQETDAMRPLRKSIGRTCEVTEL